MGQNRGYHDCTRLMDALASAVNTIAGEPLMEAAAQTPKARGAMRPEKPSPTLNQQQHEMVPKVPMGTPFSPKGLKRKRNP